MTKYIGEQQQDFENLLGPATEQLGLHDGYTSIELAGFYPFVGKGWLDPAGDYIGQTTGDISNTPVIWDSETIDGIAIVASRDKAQFDTMAQPSNLSAQAVWNTHISQNALLAGRNVYELVLNNEDITQIGNVGLDSLTSIMRMDQGVINPLQTFGSTKDELQLFNILIQKIRSMAYQLNPDMTNEDMQFLGSLLEAFYIREGLWANNPQNNRDKLRLVGLRDNEQYPKLSRLILYLSQEYRRFSKGTATERANPEMAMRVRRVLMLFSTMQKQYGYLFDVHTSYDQMNLDQSPRKIFLFGALQQSGQDVLMAQFINVMAFIMSRMSKGDMMLIYGADIISPVAWEYFMNQSYMLTQRDIKLILGFNSPRVAIASPMFQDATTTIFGQMTPTDVDDYAAKLGMTLPYSLAAEISSGDKRVYYLRRGQQNAVFGWNMVI